MKLYQLIIFILIACTFLKHGPNKEITKYKFETNNKIKTINSEVNQLQIELENLKKINVAIEDIRDLLIKNTINDE
jgi:hypothetical protein